MAQYFTDFSGYTTGAQPSDWTTRWASVSTDWRVEANAAATGSKSLNFKSGTDDNNASLLSWDAAGTPTDVEIVMRYRYTGSVFDGLPAAIAGRASGTSATKYGYFSIHYYFFEQLVALAEYANANSYVSSQVHGSSSYASSANAWYWLRLRINGTSIQGRAWADSSSEPATWTWSVTDSTTSAGGWVGVWTDGGSSLQIDIVGIGTGGDAAPKTAPAASYALSASATQGFTGSVALSAKRPISATASQSFTGFADIDVYSTWSISASGTQGFTGSVAISANRPLASSGTQGFYGTVVIKGPPTDATGLLYVRATADTLRMVLASDTLRTTMSEASLRLSAYDPLLRNQPNEPLLRTVPKGE